MTSRNIEGMAKSNYRQLRLTATHEASGLFSVRLYAKPLHASWSEHTCIFQGRGPARGPLLSTEDAIGATIDILREQLLPGIG